MSRRLNTILIICIFGTVLKLALLISAIDEFYDWDELARGFTAHEILNGPAYPVFNYQIDNYSGGSLVMGLLAVPFFVVFGESLFALKLTTIIFCLLTAIFIYLIISRYVDKDAASLAAILVFLAPHSYTRLSLVAWGDHPQMPALMTTAFFMLYEITFRNRRNTLFMILFGILCGFGLYFSYHFLTPLALCILFIFAWDRKFYSSYKFISFLLGFIIGFSPWIYFNITHDFHGLVISRYGSTFDILRNINLPEVLRKFLQLVTTAFGYSLGTDLVINTKQRLISLLYYSVFLLALGILICKNRMAIGSFFNAFIHPQRTDSKLHNKWQAIPFLFYLPIFMLFVVITPYSLKNYPPYFADRYLTTLHTCMFVIIAVAITTWWRKQGARRIVAMAMAGIVLSNGAFTQIGIIQRGISNYGILGCFMRAVMRRGFSNEFIMDDRIAYSWYRGDLLKNLDLIIKSDNLERRYYLSQALGRSLAYRAGNKFDSVLGRLAQIDFHDKDVERLIYRGLGYGRGRWYSNYLKTDLALLKSLSRLEFFLDGLQDSVVYWFDENTSQTVEFIEESIPGLFKRKFYYQLGIAIAEKNKGVLTLCLKDVAENIPRRYLGVVYKGMGEEVKRRIVCNINEKNKAVKLIQKNTPLEYQRSLINTIFGNERQ